MFSENPKVASTSDKGKDKKVEEIDKSEAKRPATSIQPNCGVLFRTLKDYQSQQADKMKAFRTFASGSDELLRGAHPQLRRLIIAIHGVTKQQAIQYWIRS